MDIRKIKKLIELVQESGVSEIEIREGEESVRISCKTEAPVYLNAPAQLQAPIANPIPASAADIHGKVDSSEEDALPDGHIVTSPMVGTMYKSPAPDAQPFVNIGTHVEVGDTLCIVEAMKMLNQIEADKAGVIAAILVENGQPVEFGQPLYVIK